MHRACYLVFLVLLIFGIAPIGKAQGDLVKIFPSGIKYQLAYLAKTTTQRVCFYRVAGAEPGAEIIDADESGEITEADALGCDTPALTCEEGSCDPTAHRNTYELTAVAVQDFYLVAIAYRDVDDVTLESARSNLGQAFISPGAPVILGGMWLADDVGGGDEA